MRETRNVRRREAKSAVQSLVNLLRRRGPAKEPWVRIVEFVAMIFVISILVTHDDEEGFLSLLLTVWSST